MYEKSNSTKYNSFIKSKKVNQHRMNIELILTNQKVIPEHTDLTEAILGELKLLAEYNDQLETFKKYYDK